MELKSLTYIIFAMIVVIFYYGVRNIPKAQRTILLVANIFFIYRFSGLNALFLVFLLSMAIFLMGILLEHIVKAGKKQQGRVVLSLGIILDIGFLCYFKFFKDTYLKLQEVLQYRGVELSDLIIPVGVSYYTLSLAGYLLDIYHKKYPAEKNYLDFFTFVTYFPAIIQGPINLYKKLLPQLKEKHFVDADKIIKGLQRCLWGYFKKVVIADRIGILVIGILQNEESAGVLLFWAMILYSFQIYTDFSGGIDVIMGVSEILDIKLIENFKAPLISQSVTEFWAKWHMSLGEFMEKYIYYPVVLNKNVVKFAKRIPNKYLQKVFSATFASIVVFIIVGIWHGTGWNYVVYGCYQAFFVSSAVLLGPIYKKLKAVLHINDKCISFKIITVLRTFIILTFGRYFIRAADLNQAWKLFGKTFSTWNIAALFDGTLLGFGLDYKNIYLLYLCILIVVAVDIAHAGGVRIREVLMRQDIVFRCFMYLLGIFGIIVFGIYGAEFSSTSFIYQGF